MKIIIPMAGRGSRLRPHTLTVPKPLVPIAGKPMVQRIVEDLKAGYGGEVEEIAFIIGDFGAQVEADLKQVAKELGAKGSIYYQNEPLGTAHAILCAKESLSGPVFVAFADTVFKADFEFDADNDGVIWVKRVEDPRAFGVVKTDDNNIITDFVEKPQEFVSDMAIVGIYYFKDGDNLRNELQYLLDNDIKDKGEYQLTNALENMKAKGLNFYPAEIEEWLDCGNKNNVVYTNSRILEIKQNTETLVSPDATIVNSVVIPPCYIGAGTTIKNSIIGPHASIGNNSSIENSVIRNSLVQNDTSVQNANFAASMLGNKATYEGRVQDISLGDFTEFRG